MESRKGAVKQLSALAVQSVERDLRAMVKAVEAGVGLLHVIDDSICESLADGWLVQVLASWSARFPGFYLDMYTASRAQMPLELQAFIDFLQEKRCAAKAAQTKARRPGRARRA